MSGQSDRSERCRELVELFSRAPIRKTFGMVLSFDDEHRAVFVLPHNAALEHALHDTHGGAIATLLDNAGWFTAAAQYDTWIGTVEMQMRLLEPARCEDLRAVGQLVRAGQKLAVCTMEVRSATGRLVATGSGTFAVTSLGTGKP